MGSDGNLRASPAKEQRERLLLLLTQGNEPFPQKFAHTHQLFQSSWNCTRGAAASLDVLQGKREFLLGVLFPSCIQAELKAVYTMAQRGGQDLHNYPPQWLAISQMPHLQSRAVRGELWGSHHLVSKELHWPVFHGPVPPGPASGKGNELQGQEW